MRRSTQATEPTTTITIRLATTTMERVDELAARELRSRSAQIAKLLADATTPETRRAE